ncbi:MAG TPA: dihydroorotate dehydrogenase [Gammaproteobacteria bacterium]|nr:dihydroorotate dehydrogenase [Gammaproteobacteria bacterium]
MSEQLSSSLKVDFCGLELNSPIVLLSGCVGFGDEYTRVNGFSLSEVGAVCLKGTTLEPRLGNTPHRICETAGGMLNSIGLQNPGVQTVVDEILPKLDHKLTHYIANISGATIEEYAEVVRVFDHSSVSAIEINISCPNVKAGGAIFGNDPEMSAAVVAACRKATSKPLITKLSPNQTDIVECARYCIDAGTDAFAAINTLMGMSIDIQHRKPVLGNIQGGLSGPAIKPIALLKVYQLSQLCRQYQIPIIGQGGITNGSDAIEFLLAGASTIGVGTGLFYDPLVCQKLNREVLDYLNSHRIASVQELVGKLEL